LYFLFIFDLLCKRFFSSPCIGSAVYGFIYKAGRKIISKESLESNTVEMELVPSSFPKERGRPRPGARVCIGVLERDTQLVNPCDIKHKKKPATL
jgi:hypothetical protein